MVSFGKLRNQGRICAVLGLAAIGFAVAPNSANAFTLVNRTGFTDADFENLRTQGQFTELFVAESRMGDNLASAGNHEIDIIGDTKKSFTPDQAGNRTWLNGQILDFVLEYTGSQVTYSVDGQTLSSSNFTGGASDIFLRTFAKPAGSQSSLSDLVFNGTSIGSLQSAAITNAAVTTADTDYLQITGVTAPFRLTGKSSFAWTGTTPRNSNIAYQIKVGNTSQSIPEPGMVAAVVVAGAASVINKRKKQASASLD
jgi:hypothetical protein